jgi:hypothetical protein
MFNLNLVMGVLMVMPIKQNQPITTKNSPSKEVVLIMNELAFLSKVNSSNLK